MQDRLLKIIKAVPGHVGEEVRSLIEADPTLLDKLAEIIFARLRTTVFVVDRKLDEPSGTHALLGFGTTFFFDGYVLADDGRIIQGMFEFDESSILLQVVPDHE